MPPTSGEMASIKSPAIGIDLGTWKCCVAVFREGKVEIIENERGSKTTPSYVAFTETERLVGEDAKDQVALNPTNTVFGVKRIIGRWFGDPHVKTHLGNFPFTTKQVCGSERTEIRVQYRRESKWLPPEHFTAMLLRKMKLTAEAYLGCPVREAVVSIPVCFNSAQRQATLDAAEIAGLKVLQLLHEPTAVALAYKDQAGSGTLNQTVMMVDAGGGTLQAAVASLKDGLVDVKAVSGNAQFGGCDLDQFLVDECSKRLQFTQKIDISKNKKALERLRVACHKAKCDLTMLPQTTIQVDSLVKDTDFETTIHREEFSKLFRERSAKLISEVVKDALKGAHLNVDQIDRVFVVGGSSRVPAITTQLEGLFPGKKLNTCVNIDEAVAHGAALQAALLAGDHTVANTSVSDVTPRDFYLEHASNRTERGIVFGKNCTIPLEKIWNVSCGISGEQTLNLLEEDFGLKPIKSYELQFSYLINIFRKKQFLFKIDRNGLISELPAPLHKSGSVSVPKSYNWIFDIQPRIRVEKSFQSDEKNEAMRLQASMKLESTCIEIKSAVKGFQNGNGDQKFIKTYGKKCSGLITSCNEYIVWLDNNSNVSMRKCTSKIEELKERFEVLSVAFNSVIRIKSEGNETTENNMKPARQSKNRPPKINVSKSMLATEEHFLSVPDIRRSRLPQASDASAMHGGGIDSRLPQASDTSAMHGGEIDNRFPQASDSSAMHGGGIDGRFPQASDTSAMHGGGIDSRFPQASDTSAMHGGWIDGRFTQSSDTSAMHGGGIDGQFTQSSDTSAMHGGGIDSRFPQASDASAMHGGGIDSRFPQASDASAMHGGGIDGRFPQASDASAMHGGGIDGRFPQVSDASAMHGGGIDSRFPQTSDISAMHGGGIDSRFPQASDTLAMHGGGIDIAIVKHAVENNPPETGKDQFDLRNKQIDAQNERSASPSISSKSDQVQRVGITKRDEYPRFTEPNLPSSDDSNSLTSAKSLPSERRKSSVAGSSPASPQNGAASQRNHIVCVSRASRSSSECDVTLEDKTPLDSVEDRQSVVRKQTDLRSPNPETCISNQSSVVLADAKSANLSARNLRNVTSGERSEGSLDTTATNSKDKRGGEQGCEESNSTTIFKQDTEASHNLLVSEQGFVEKHAIRDNRHTTYLRLPKTVNKETSIASNQANSIVQQIEERLSTTSNGSEISSSKTAGGPVTSPDTTARSTVTSLRAKASGSVTSPSTADSGPVTSPSTAAIDSVTSPSTTASDLVTSFRTTPSGSVTSPSTTARSSVTSLSTTAGGYAATASSSVTKPRTSDCKQGSDNSKSQVIISSSLTLYSKVHNESKTETGIGVDVYDTGEKNSRSPVRVQENTKAYDLTSNQNQQKIFKKRSREILAEYTIPPRTYKIFGGEVDSCEQIVKKQCHWNRNSEFVPSSSMDRDGGNSCINRKDVCDRRNRAINNGAKQSDEGSSVSEGNGEVNRVDGRRQGGRSVSLERMRRLAGEGRQEETSAGNKATSEAKGGGYGPVRKHSRDAGPVTAINEMPCFLVRGRKVEIRQEETSKQLNDSTEAQKITQPRQSSPRKSGVIHTGSTKSTPENETAIAIDKQATSQLRSQSAINELNTSKPATASLHHLSKPHQKNIRPEKQPNQGHYQQQQQLPRQHITSQQNTSSTHQRQDPAIGIDLGTWKCCVAVVREGKMEIIENEQGSKTTPSYVAFTETERLVGEDAKNQVAINPTNTVFGVKRIIGREFNDQSLQKDMKFWPFTVTPDQHDRPRIQLEYREQKKVLSPEQVSAMMLEKMKHIAESHLGCEVRDAVISVPAYFNNSQRQATKDAGAIAGLNVLGLINEPTAAALAYRDNKARVEPHNVLIFDLGGGTFDVAVIRVDESGVKVKGVCGDAEFGGNEMDVLLMKHFDEEFFEKHGKHVLQDKKGLERLRTASEIAKKTLSLLPKANVQVDSLIEEIDFSASIKRHDFEQLFYTDAKERIVNVLTNVLKRTNIPPSEIDEVILVGGTSRIPKIQSILKEFFVGKALNKTVNPDEAVAHGAALRAALLSGDIEVEEVYVDDMFQVQPSMEIERMDGKFRNYRAIPKEGFHILNCSIKDEDEESEERFSHKETVMKTHRLNSFGIFEIFAWGNENAKETRMPEIGCLAEPEITQLADQVHQFAKDDQELKEGVAAMSDLEAFCFKTKALMTSNSLRRKLGQNELRGIADRCEEMICWLDDNDSATKSNYQHKKRELCCKILSVMEKGNVKMEDFYLTEQEWFRELLKSQSEKSTQIKPCQQNPPHLPWHETPTPVNYEHRRPSQQLMQLTALANLDLKQLQQLTRQPLSPIKQEQLPSPSKQEQLEPPQHPPAISKQEQLEPTQQPAQQPPSPTKHEQHDPPLITMQPPTAPTRQVQPEPPQPTQPAPAQTKQEQPKPTQLQSAPGNPMPSISYDPSIAPPHQGKLVSARGAATQAHASELLETTLRSDAPPHQVRLVSARGAATQAHASEPVETTLQSDAPPHQVKPVSARGAATQAHASEPVETTLQSDALPHQVKPVSARGAATQAQAIEPVETTLQSDEDSKHKIEDDSADYRAAETEGGRQSLLHNYLGCAVELPKPSENVLKSPQFRKVSNTNDNSETRPNALHSYVFTPPTKLTNRVDSFTPNAQDAGNRLGPLTMVSRIVSSSNANQSLSLSVVPAIAHSTEHTGLELTSTSSSDSGISSPCVPDLSAKTDFLESNIISLNGASISSAASHSEPQSKSLGSRPPRSVVESIGGVDSAQEMLMAGLRPARANSCNINNGVEIKCINDKTIESNEPIKNQQQQPLSTDDGRVEACEAAVEKAFDALVEPRALEQGALGNARRSCIESTSAKNAELRDESKCNIGQIHEQVTKPVRLMHQCSGSSDLSTKSIYYCSEETDYSYDCRTKEDSQLHFSAQDEHKVPFDIFLEQFVKNSAYDPITRAQKSFPSQFVAAVLKRDSQELFDSPITRQNRGKYNDTHEDQFSGQNSAASSSITRNSVPQVFTNSNQATTTFHNKCEISSHIPKLASTNSGNGLQQQVRPEHRNRLCPLSSGTSPLAPCPSSAEEQSLNYPVLHQGKPEHHPCPPPLGSGTSPSAPRPSSTEEQPLNSHVRQRPWSAILLRPQEGHRFQPYTGIGDLERGRRRSACDTGRDDEFPPLGIVHKRIRFFSNRKK